MPEKFNIPKDAKENPLLKLDVVLIFLYTNDRFLQTLDEIQKGVYEHIESDDNETALILGKLEKDEFIIKHPCETAYTESGTPKIRIEYQFAITFEGKIFLKQGGYSSEDIRSREQNTRLEILENELRENRKWTLYLTILIALGTLVAAIYYSIEVLNRFSPVLHQHHLYWIWETIPKKMP